MDEDNKTEPETEKSFKLIFKQGTNFLAKFKVWGTEQQNQEWYVLSRKTGSIIFF